MTFLMNETSIVLFLSITTEGLLQNFMFYIFIQIEHYIGKMLDCDNVVQELLTNDGSLWTHDKIFSSVI